MSGVAGLVADPVIEEFYGRLGTPQVGHTIHVSPIHKTPPEPYTGWRRMRTTYEWVNLSLLLQAVDHPLNVSANQSKNDGTGAYTHPAELAPGSFVGLAGRSTGVLHIVSHRQPGSDWWQSHFTGLYTATPTADPDGGMGGDCWSIQGRFVTQGGAYGLQSYNNESGRTSLATLYDWPT